MQETHLALERRHAVAFVLGVRLITLLVAATVPPRPDLAPCNEPDPGDAGDGAAGEDVFHSAVRVPLSVNIDKVSTIEGGRQGAGLPPLRGGPMATGFPQVFNGVSTVADLLNLHPEMRRRAALLVRVFRAFGYRAIITSGYRSATEQADLYRRFLRGETRLPVAQPGHSTHNFGLAVDVVTDAPFWMRAAIARSVGLVFAGSADDVHYDPFGFRLWRQILESNALS